MVVSNYIEWILGIVIGVPMVACLWLVVLMLIKVLRGDDLL